MRIKWCHVVVAAILFFCIQLVETRKHKDASSGREITMGTLSEPYEKAFHESQKFMQHQIRKPYKNRGWRHGRSSSSSSESNELRIRKKHRSKSQTRKKQKDAKENSSPSKDFQNFIKSHDCGNSPVYHKFMALYRKAIKQNPKDVSNLSWLKQLADAEKVNKEDSKQCPSIPALCTGTTEVLTPKGNTTDGSKPVTKVDETPTSITQQVDQVQIAPIALSTAPPKIIK